MELTTACRYFSCSRLLESVWAWPEKEKLELKEVETGQAE